MLITKLKIIKNHPLPDYLKLKDWLIFKYQGSDLKFLLETVFLALSVEKEAKKIGHFHVGIDCKEEYKPWIPDPIKYFNLNKIDINLPGIYRIIQFSHLRTNHAELAKSLGIKYPLDIKNPFSNKCNDKSVIIACNGMKEISIPDKHEKYMYEYFISKGYTVKLLNIPIYNYKDCWSKDISIKPSSLQDTIDIFNSSEIIICTDNCFLTLANTFLEKKVIGIFGPTEPKSLLAYNSMKILQIVDEDYLTDPRIKKSCPCEGPKFCHRKYKIGNFPYCFSSISPDILMKRIEILL